MVLSAELFSWTRATKASDGCTFKEERNVKNYTFILLSALFVDVAMSIILLVPKLLKQLLNTQAQLKPQAEV